MTEHREIMVKVNAPVDEGVAPLVSALSAVEGLVTMESCQGEPSGRNAFVVFRLGSWRDCGKFLFDQLLPAMPDDLRAEISLRVDAFDSDFARGWITLPQELVEPLGRCILQLAPISPGAALGKLGGAGSGAEPDAGTAGRAG
jgi:hypothetical protein